MSRILFLVMLVMATAVLLLSGCMIHPLPPPGHNAYRSHPAPPGHHVYRPAPRQPGAGVRPHHFYHPW